MKKKLLVLSASAVLASHFLVGGEASAIVSGEKILIHLKLYRLWRRVVRHQSLQNNIKRA